MIGRSLGIEEMSPDEERRVAPSLACVRCEYVARAPGPSRSAKHHSLHPDSKRLRINGREHFWAGPQIKLTSFERDLDRHDQITIIVSQKHLAR